MKKIESQIAFRVIIEFPIRTGAMKICPIDFPVQIFLSQSNFSAFINPSCSLIVNLKCNFSRLHVFPQEFNESSKYHNTWHKLSILLTKCSWRVHFVSYLVKLCGISICQEFSSWSSGCTCRLFELHAKWGISFISEIYKISFLSLS